MRITGGDSPHLYPIDYPFVAPEAVRPANQISGPQMVDFALKDGNRGRTRTRLIQGALLIGLILISFITITSLTPGGPLWGNGLLPPVTTSPPTKAEGLLVVNVGLGYSYPISWPGCSSNPPTNESVGFVPPANNSFVLNNSVVFVPLYCSLNVLPRNVTFAAIQQGLRFPERHAFVVPIPGQNSIAVGVGNYSITTQNPFFNLTTFETVTQGNKTELKLQLTETLIAPKMTEAADPDMSGKLGPWGAVNVLIQTGTLSFYGGEPVFLEASYSHLAYCSNCNATRILRPPLSETTPATVGLILNNPEGYWATLVPKSSIDLQNLADVWVVVISTSYRVV